MRLPDFLIVGAAKSGTTSLYHFLGQHPDIFMSAVKELGFFALKNDVQFNGPGDMNAIGCCSVNTLEAYSALFAEAAVVSPPVKAAICISTVRKPRTPSRRRFPT